MPNIAWKPHLALVAMPFVLSTLLSGCGGPQAVVAEAWKVANLLTRAKYTSTPEPEYKEVENCCGNGSTYSVSCGAGTSSDVSLTVGGSAGVDLGGQVTFDPQVAAQLGFNQNSGQSVELALPPAGTKNIYKITRTYTILGGQATLNSAAGESRVADYTFNASCSILAQPVGEPMDCDVICSPRQANVDTASGSVALLPPEPPATSEPPPIPTPTTTPEPPTATSTATPPPPPVGTPIPIPQLEQAIQDVRVRRAIAHCTDRRTLVQSVYPTLTDAEADALAMDSFLPNSHWAYSPPVTRYAFDPAQGQAFLDQVGWRSVPGATYRTNAEGDELHIRLTTTSAAFRQVWTGEFSDQMRVCGIRVSVLAVPAAWWFGDSTGLARRDYQLGAYAWVTEDDDDLSNLQFQYACSKIPSEGNGWYGQNYLGWCNLLASQAVEQAGNTQLALDERRSLVAVLQEEFMRDVPSLPLFRRLEEGEAAGGSVIASPTWEHIDFNLSQ